MSVPRRRPRTAPLLATATDTAARSVRLDMPLAPLPTRDETASIAPSGTFRLVVSQVGMTQCLHETTATPRSRLVLLLSNLAASCGGAASSVSRRP